MKSGRTDTTLSLLDRLIDEDPESLVDPIPTDAELRRQVRESIQRNVDMLLNSRSWLGTWPTELKRIRYSIVNFGLPDTSGIAIDNNEVKSILSQTVRMALDVFEPRLTEVNVTILAGPGSRRARVLISAKLRSDLETIVLGGLLGQSGLIDLTKARS